MSALAQELRQIDATATPLSADLEWYSVADGRRVPPVFSFAPVVYLSDLQIDGQLRKLPFPLKLEIAPGEDCGYVVFAPAIDVGGCGRSVESALRDLTETALSLIESYSDEPLDQLHSSAVEALRRLRTALGLQQDQ